jgi:hypothetical protein
LISELWSILFESIGVRPILLENKGRSIHLRTEGKPLLLENRMITHYISEQKKGQFYVPAEGKLILLDRKSKAHRYGY